MNATISSMRDEVVRIKEGDLMELRSRVHQLERQVQVLESLLRAEYNWHRDRTRAIQHHLPETKQAALEGRPLWPGEDTLP